VSAPENAALTLRDRAPMIEKIGSGRWHAGPAAARPLALARPWGNELKVFSGRVPSGSNQHVVRSSLPLARRSALKMPEGPYETGDIEGSGRPATPDAGHFFMLYERLQFEAQQALGLSADSRETRIIIHLVRSHLAGRLVTSSSLAAASGLSYGTAIRTIEKMCKDKLILKRPRTPTGKSVSLHPSGELLARWHSFARRGNDLVHALLARGPLADEVATSTRPTAERTSVTLPPPTVLTEKLSLPRGLRVLMHADPTFMAMRSLKRQFEMILGVPIRSRALSIDRLHDEVVENSQLPVSKYDIIAVDFPWFGEMAANGWLLPLDDLVEEADRADFYPDTLATSRWRGTQYGVPSMMTAELLVYRTDLLDRAGIAPPRTIAATIEAARRLHDPANGINGIAWNGARGTPLGHSFIMIMSAFGQPILNLRPTGEGFDAESVAAEEMRPMFLSLEARQTVEYLLEILQYSPPDVLTMTWYDRAIAYGRGRAALAYSHTLLAQVYETDPQSPAYRRTSYLPHPTGPRGRPIVPMGGYGLAIPANLTRDRVDAARTALRTLTSASAIKLYSINGSLASPRRSVSRDPEVQAMSPVVASVEEMATGGLVRMWPRPPVPPISDIISIAGEEVHELLSGNKSIGAALRDAQNRANACMFPAR
jgi:multiple sugar transport system substrate-binding protein